MNPEQFVIELQQNGFDLTQTQINQFHHYFKKLVEVNESVNLTAITDEEDVYLKHFFDSITPLIHFKDYFQGPKKLADIGAGAGFPSIPMKILQPDLHVTIVDSLNKRLKFLSDLVDELGLDNVSLVHGRAEDIGRDKNHREKYDLATARAVARLNILSEYCLPFVKPNGYMVALKGSSSLDEISESKRALDLLKGKLIDNLEINLPTSNEPRALTLIEKVGQTPKAYPRKAGTPTRKPL